MSNEPGPMGQPTNFVPQHIACYRHMEPFRSQWPKGWPMFFTKVWTALLQNPEFRDQCRDTIEHCKQLLETKNPMCCWLPPDQLLSIYQEVNAYYVKVDRKPLWEDGQCVRCGNVRAGSPYQAPKLRTPKGIKKTTPDHKHICLQCFCARLKS